MEELKLKPLKVEKGNSTIYDINYHIVFCPKYRKNVLTEKIRDDLKLIFQTITSSNLWKIIEMEIMEDHVHLFISAHPKFSPTDIVKKLKGISARQIFLKHLEFKKKEYWGGHLWSKGYFIGTVGNVTKDAIRKYIQSNTKLNTLGNSSNH